MTDPFQVLSRLETALRLHAPLSICYRSPICKCPLEGQGQSQGQGCVCDSDECFDVASFTFELLSNCKSQFLFRIKHGVLKCTKKRHLRIYYLDTANNDNEVTLVEVDTSHQRMRVHDNDSSSSNNSSTVAVVVDFPLDEPPVCLLGSLVLNVGYLEFDEGSTPQ